MRERLLPLLSCAAGMLLPAVRAEVVVTALPQPQVFFNDFPNLNLYPLDLNNDAMPDFTFGASAGSVSLRTERANRVVYHIDAPPNLGGPVQRLPEGFLIGNELGTVGLDWRSADLREGYVSPGEIAFVNIVHCLSTGCSSTWPPGPSQRGFIGLEFQLDDGLHYGYFDVSVSGNNPAARLYGWAYETIPNMPLAAAPVPEPSTWALLGLGGVVLLWRWRT